MSIPRRKSNSIEKPIALKPIKAIHAIMSNQQLLMQQGIPQTTRNAFVPRIQNTMVKQNLNIIGCNEIKNRQISPNKRHRKMVSAQPSQKQVMQSARIIKPQNIRFVQVQNKQHVTKTAEKDKENTPSRMDRYLRVVDQKVRMSNRRRAKLGLPQQDHNLPAFNNAFTTRDDRRPKSHRQSMSCTPDQFGDFTNVPILQDDMKNMVSKTPSFYTEQKDTKNIKQVVFSNNGAEQAVHIRPNNFWNEPEPENLKQTIAAVQAPLKIPKNLIKFSTNIPDQKEKDADSGGSTKSNSNKNSNRKARRKIIRKVYIQQNQKLIEQRVQQMAQNNKMASGRMSQMKHLGEVDDLSCISKDDSCNSNIMSECLSELSILSKGEGVLTKVSSAQNIMEKPSMNLLTRFKTGGKETKLCSPTLSSEQITRPPCPPKTSQHLRLPNESAVSKMSLPSNFKLVSSIQQSSRLDKNDESEYISCNYSHSIMPIENNYVEPKQNNAQKSQSDVISDDFFDANNNSSAIVRFDKYMMENESMKQSQLQEDDSQVASIKNFNFHSSIKSPSSPTEDFMWMQQNIEVIVSGSTSLRPTFKGTNMSQYNSNIVSGQIEKQRNHNNFSPPLKNY